MAESYYSFSLNTGGAVNTGAYYYISITQNSGTYDGAAITIYPTNTQPSYFNYRSNSVQWQAPPAGRLTVGTTVVTGGNAIIGVLGVSPGINVDVTLVCYGNAGEIGSVTLSPGQTEVPFNFAVNPGESIGDTGGEAFLAKNAAKPEIAE